MEKIKGWVKIFITTIGNKDVGQVLQCDLGGATWSENWAFTVMNNYRITEIRVCRISNADVLRSILMYWSPMECRGAGW
ncbi:MAG: hypothetical protein WBB19_12065 [Desulforhopalus sp.]